MSLSEAKERISRLEATVGQRADDENCDLCAITGELGVLLEHTRRDLNESKTHWNERCDAHQAQVAGAMAKMQAMKEEMALLRRVFGHQHQPEENQRSSQRI